MGGVDHYVTLAFIDFITAVSFLFAVYYFIGLNRWGSESQNGLV